MHRVIRTILVASISSVSIAQAQDVVIPATIIAGRPHVQVMVNGKGPFWFGVDTGAEGIGRADARLVEALSLPMDSSVAVTDAITTQRQKTARIASLDLGGIVIRNAALPSKAYNMRLLKSAGRARDCHNKQPGRKHLRPGCSQTGQKPV